MSAGKLGFASRTYRHINRYRQIVTVLVKYGFGELLEQLRIGQYLEVGYRLIARQRQAHVESLTTAQRVRMALEELGPTFIKLGQVLSTRPDLVPPEFITEFTRLQQQVPPFPVDQVRAIVATELGRPLEEVYARFDAQPLAAASIGQVHRAALPDGQEVVVKVQRPGIEKTIATDVEILAHLAGLVEKHSEEWRLHRPTRIVAEFGRVIERELDFRTEAAHLERFAAQFADDRSLYVPKVYREATSRRVLTLEYVPVTPVSDQIALRAAGFDPALIAQRGLDLTLKQIFVHGFFHADPHPGNVFVLPGNVICLLDFGMMGRLDRRARESFADLVYAVARRDPGHATAALLRLTSFDDEHEPDARAIEADLAQFIDLNIPARLGDLDFGKLVHELLSLVRRHRLSIPPDMVTMLKAAATAERLVTRLDPELNVMAAAAPYLRRLKLDRLRPQRVWREVLDSGGEFLQLVREIPGGVRDLLRLSKRGRLRIGFEHRGLEELLETHERVANRVAFAIVVAALIVGSSLLVQSRLPPLWGDIPLIGLIGYVTAGALGLLLLISIIRHGRL